MFDTDWKTSSAVNIPEELSCLCLAAAEHQKKLSLFKGFWAGLRQKLGGMDGTERPFLFLFGVSVPKHMSASLPEKSI